MKQWRKRCTKTQMFPFVDTVLEKRYNLEIWWQDNGNAMIFLVAANDYVYGTANDENENECVKEILR